MSALASVDAAQISAVAEDVFTALVDGEPGHLFPDVAAELGDPLYAWVDMHADVTGRVLLAVDAGTARRLTRALLRMDDAEPVEDEDLADAFGEVANVVGGNLKALLPVQGSLTLPSVGRTAPLPDGATVVDRVPLAWRGQPVDISVWEI
jgi:CheY-specific phosphatase CheX